MHAARARPVDAFATLPSRRRCAVSGDGSSIMTGSYSNMFHVYNRDGQLGLSMELTKCSTAGGSKNAWNHRQAVGMAGKNGTAPLSPAPAHHSVDFGRRVLHLAWHPQRDVVAVAGLDKLYLYSVSNGVAGYAASPERGAAGGGGL